LCTKNYKNQCIFVKVVVKKSAPFSCGYGVDIQVAFQLQVTTHHHHHHQFICHKTKAESSCGDVVICSTTCVENLTVLGNLTAVGEMSGILLNFREIIFVREKLPKTVYCKLHICIHTGI